MCRKPFARTMQKNSTATSDSIIITFINMETFPYTKP